MEIFFFTFFLSVLSLLIIVIANYDNDNADDTIKNRDIGRCLKISFFFVIYIYLLRRNTGIRASKI